MTQQAIFADSGLPTVLVDNLGRFNPWWENEAMPAQPPARRHLVAQIRRRLDAHIAPIVVVRGSRQIGKTTAQFQIIQDLLDEGVDARRILRVQFDDLRTLTQLQEPILRISDWFERRIAPKRFNTLAQAGATAYLFFDEVQNLDRWDAQLKSLVDNASVKVVVTGSSALRIELGRDSLAGRINTIEAGVLSLTEIGTLRGYATPRPFLKDNGLADLLDKAFWVGLREYGIEHRDFRQETFTHFSDRGGYPTDSGPVGFRSTFPLYRMIWRDARISRRWPVIWRRVSLARWPRRFRVWTSPTSPKEARTGRLTSC